MTTNSYKLHRLSIELQAPQGTSELYKSLWHFLIPDFRRMIGEFACDAQYQVADSLQPLIVQSNGGDEIFWAGSWEAILMV